MLTEDARNQSDCYTFQRLRLLLTFVSQASQASTWVFLGFAAILCCFSSLSPRVVVGFFVVFACLSLFVHLVQESSSVWNEFPYWRSVEKKTADRIGLQLPLFLAILLIDGRLYFQESHASALVFLFVSVAVDCGVAYYASQISEKTIREICKSLWKKRDRSITQDPLINVDKLTDAKVTDNLDCVEEVPLQAPKEHIARFYWEDDEKLLATQYRKLTSNSVDQIFGKIRVEIPENSNVGVVYIPFCPPFEDVPALEYEQTSGAELSIKATSVQPFGVRLEARLLDNDDQDSEEDLFIDYYAAFTRS